MKQTDAGPVASGGAASLGNRKLEIGLERDRLDRRRTARQQLGDGRVDERIPRRRTRRVAADQVLVLMRQQMPILAVGTSAL